MATWAAPWSLAQATVFFRSDAGEVQEVNVSNPLDRVRAGTLHVTVPFQVTSDSSTGAYVQPVLRTVWAELDSGGTRIAWDGAASGWRGVDESIGARVINFSIQDGSGGAVVALPVGGNRRGSNYPRRYLSDLGTASIEVRVYDGRGGAGFDPDDASTSLLGQEVFPLSTQFPDIHIGSYSGLYLEPGEVGHECFVCGFRAGSAGATYSISAIPGDVVELSTDAVVIDGAGWATFSVTALEIGDFRLQGSRPDGTVVTSRLYHVRPVAEVGEPSSEAATSGGGGNEAPPLISVYHDGRRCRPAAMVSVGPEGYYQECGRCVPQPQLPQKACHYDGDGQHGGLYFPGACVRPGSQYGSCVTFISSLLFSLDFSLADKGYRPCYQKTDGTWSGSVGVPLKIGEAGLSYTGSTITTEYTTRCCVWHADIGSPTTMSIRGVDCD